MKAWGDCVGELDHTAKNKHQVFDQLDKNALN